MSGQFAIKLFYEQIGAQLHAFHEEGNEQLILSVAIGKRKRAFVVFFFF